MKRLFDRYRDTVYGLAPSAIILMGVFVLQQHYGYLRTSFDKSVSGIEAGTMYLLESGHAACIGDIVRYTSKKANQRKYYRRIAAGPGSRIRITESGYLVDDTAYEMVAEWREMAIKEAKEQGADITIPENHFLIINTEFKKMPHNSDWAFEILPRQQIDNRITHVLFSRELARIGERIAVAADGCAG